MRCWRFWKSPRRKAWLLGLAALAVPAVGLAVSEVITRDTNQTPCFARTNDAGAECRNLRMNDTTKGLLVHIAGTESGGLTVTQGAAQSTLAPWPMVPIPHTAGSGFFLLSNTGTNVDVSVTRPGVSGQAIYVTMLCASYRGPTATTGLRVQLSDGALSFITSVNASAVGPGQACVAPPVPLRFSTGAGVTATLFAGGAGVVGDLTVAGFQF